MSGIGEESRKVRLDLAHVPGDIVYYNLPGNSFGKGLVTGFVARGLTIDQIQYEVTWQDGGSSFFNELELTDVNLSLM